MPDGAREKADFIAKSRRRGTWVAEEANRAEFLILVA
jgi:hypothetical protein